MPLPNSSIVPYAKVAGLIPGQVTYKNQPMNAWISETTNWHFFSLSTCLPASLNQYIKKKSLFQNL